MSYICELVTCIARNCLSVSNNILSIYLCKEHLNDLDLVTAIDINMKSF